MSQENVEIVRHSINAFNRGDLEEALSDYARDAEWHTTGRFADERIYRGPGGIERFWTELQEDVEELRLSVSDIRAVGEDKVFVAGLAEGRGKRSKAHSEEPAWYVVTFRDRLIVRVEAYADSAEALEAAGLPE